MLEKGAQDVVATVEGTAKGGLGLVEFTTHAGILGPLAGEQERQPGRRVALGRLRRGIGGRGELFGGFGRGGGDDSEPVVEVRTAGIGAEADVSQGKIGLSPEVRLIAGGQLSQGLGSFGRQGQNVERAFGFRGRAYGPAGRFFQDDMGIGAAHAEGTDAGETRPFPYGQGMSRGRDPTESSFHGICGLASLSADVAESPGAQRQHDLHQARDPGRRLQVAEVGLHRTDNQRVLCRSRLCPALLQGP